MPNDVIVIGAGMSGLAAGIRAAMFDRKVVILERHSVWGGLNSFYNYQGHQFDVGLHAMTNYAAKNARGLPLTRLLKQLRIRHEQLDLCEQGHSAVSFPGVKLRFSNNFELLRSEVARAFPAEVDGFDALAREVDGYDELDLSAANLDARPVVERHIKEPLLREMLFCPLMYYGSAREDEMDWYQFVIMFKAIFQQGFARPQNGVRHILKLLTAKYRELGGELKMKAGVARLIVENGATTGVELEGGETLTAPRVLSSAGWAETLRLAGREPALVSDLGRLSFTESISVLDRPAAEIGIDETIIFFSNREQFRYRRPEGLCDQDSGVICMPGNFNLREPLKDQLVRITNIASHPRWRELEEDDYRAAKEAAYKASVDAAVAGGHIPDFRGHVTLVDSFTPRTIEHYTGHLGGAVYGSPLKRRDGRTPVEGLHVIGTDQGFLGITGAMLSGITIANSTVLSS